MGIVSPSQLQKMCENTLKFMAETRPKNDKEESEVEKAIWDKRDECVKKRKDRRLWT